MLERVMGRGCVWDRGGCEKGEKSCWCGEGGVRYRYTSSCMNSAVLSDEWQKSKNQSGDMMF